ncbi:TPA: molecular chaperone [Escherichia coli]|uniref:fimbrial biogenesis chaperone n=1 Tax=Escherichia coli TaxID=562 RepID=UPI00300686F6
MMLRVFSIISLLLTSSITKAEILYPWPGDTEVRLNISGEKGLSRGTLRVTNPGDAPWLVQAWAEDEQYRRFNVAYPSVYRLEPFSAYALNIYPSSNIMSEKLKWLLISFIPSTMKNNSNQLVMPVTYRLKLINESTIKGN